MICTRRAHTWLASGLLALAVGPLWAATTVPPDGGQSAEGAVADTGGQPAAAAACGERLVRLEEQIQQVDLNPQVQLQLDELLQAARQADAEGCRRLADQAQTLLNDALATPPDPDLELHRARPDVEVEIEQEEPEVEVTPVQNV